MRSAMKPLVALGWAGWVLGAAPTLAADALAAFAVENQAIGAPLAGVAGDAAAGRALLLARDPANCVLCHALPDPELRFAGDVGPPLAGAGARLSAPELRLIVVDQSRRNPQTVMPSYYRIDGLARVASQWRDKPILTARQVEDIVAYLATLK